MVIFKVKYIYSEVRKIKIKSLEIVIVIVIV